jgi:hypothetical protein
MKNKKCSKPPTRSIYSCAIFQNYVRVPASIVHQDSPNHIKLSTAKKTHIFHWHFNWYIEIISTFIVYPYVYGYIHIYYPLILHFHSCSPLQSSCSLFQGIFSWIRPIPPLRTRRPSRPSLGWPRHVTNFHHFGGTKTDVPCRSIWIHAVPIQPLFGSGYPVQRRSLLYRHVQHVRVSLRNPCCYLN